KDVKALIQQAETMAEELTETVRTANSTLAKVDEKIEPVTDEVLALSANLRSTSEDASAFLRVATEKTEQLDIQGLAGKLDQVLEEVSGLTVQLRASVENLDESSASMLHEADNIEYSIRTTL